MDVAKNINASMEEMLADDVEYTSRAGRVLERIMASSGLFVGVVPAPEELGDAPEIKKTEAILRRLADTTGGVILGRAGVFVLQGHPAVLHVRLHGEVEAGCRPAAAREQQQTDRARLA
jgi:hypothetical protein